MVYGRERNTRGEILGRYCNQERFKLKTAECVARCVPVLPITRRSAVLIERLFEEIVQ